MARARERYCAYVSTWSRDTDCSPERRRTLQGVTLAALVQIRGLRRAEREPVSLRLLEDRRRAALVRRGLHAREKRVHRVLRAVEGPLLILIDRLHGARELLGLARELLIRLVHRERERGDHVAVRSEERRVGKECRSRW